MPEQTISAFPADLVRSSMLRMPRRLTNQDSWHGHIPFAFWCIEALAPRVLVELGCHKGDSYCAFCQAVEGTGTGTRCYGVDTWKGDPHAGLYGEDVFTELRQYHDPRYGAFSTLVRSTFDEATERFRDSTVDLLHIDGAHTYEDVRRDFSTWLPKISRSGVVLFHDIEVREDGFGVFRFWEEVRRQYPSFAFSHSHGLGVLAVGPSPPEPLRRLTGLDERDREEVRRLFGRLGAAVLLASSRQARARQRVRIAQLEGVVEDQVRHSDAQARSIESLQSDVARFLSDVMQLHEQKEAILRSTSWKISAPLRAAGTLVQRLRGVEAPTVPPSDRQEPERAEPEPGPENAEAPPPEPVAAPPPTFVRALLADPGATLAFPEAARPEVSIVVVTFNRVEHTYACLESLLAHADVPYELIVVDNASSDLTRELLDRLRGATILRNDENTGFGRACNQAAAIARGDHLLFLNNDAEIAPRCLSALLETAKDDPRCGAVGGRLVRPDGRLQEAGSILWSDGSAESFGRGADPFAGEFSYPREVDYCSGALLLVRRAAFDKLGGFDDRFAPAYYEDADLCMGLRRLGYRVMYQPAATARHQEHGSSSPRQATELMLRNHGRFVEKWADELRRQRTRSSGEALRARERVHRPRVLVIDDRVPVSEAGSGYPRAHALLRLFRRHEYPVTFFPIHDATPVQPSLGVLQREGVEVLCDGRPFGEFAAERAGLYDLVFVSRPHNFATASADLRRCFPRAVIVYDAEALFFVRDELKASVVGAPTEAVAEWKEAAELGLMRFAHLVVAVSEREKRLLERAAPELRGQVAVWGHPVDARPTPRPFKERKDLLFIGSFFAPHSPNVDALSYLVERVLPLVFERLDCRLRVVGWGAREAASHLASERVEVVGYVEDLTPLYDECRVFVVPHRYSAGIPLKLCEALARGLPAVVSDLTALQLGVEDGREVLVGASAEALADRLVDLYTGEALWSRLREQGLDFARRRFDPEMLGRELDDIVAAAVASGTLAAPSGKRE